MNYGLVELNIFIAGHFRFHMKSLAVFLSGPMLGALLSGCKDPKAQASAVSQAAQVAQRHEADASVDSAVAAYAPAHPALKRPYIVRVEGGETLESLSVDLYGTRDWRRLFADNNADEAVRTVWFHTGLSVPLQLVPLPFYDGASPHRLSAGAWVRAYLTPADLHAYIQAHPAREIHDWPAFDEQRLAHPEIKEVFFEDPDGVVHSLPIAVSPDN